ncbi:hypothetical protein AAE02nite_29680 [Adhaeribacter aerolatus]|uniref:STAS/SEC14 domain-containing protein n=1 Tax=Adhaeribacter aerolatus TaxID=670289 RepID=A0A512B022_9BACT|nr:hypothetical protein [Adhaeribacter aerolatus]GEO05304.1 hypothetical protein AAE02nite_29680 [Adhaeribacter aerolatus]
MPVLLFSESFIQISYNAEENWVYANWIGFQTVKSVKEGCEQILQALIDESCHKVLNDNTHVEGIWSGAAAWVGTEWFPRLSNAGIKCFAWVYSPSTFSQLSTDKVLNHTKESFVRVFYNIEEAKTWLRS